MDEMKRVERHSRSGQSARKAEKPKRERMAEPGTLAAIAQDAISRYGSGVKEHLVAFGGVDNETGQHLKRSLEGISKSKVHPDFQKQNLKQQAGFAAETKEVARRRAEQAIAGKKPTITRTDDIPGHVNDQLFDISCKVDAAGNPVAGASAQMKFVGGTPKAAVHALMGERYDKYLNSGGKMLVPRDYYEGMQEELAKRATSLERQISRLKADGKPDKAATKQAQLKKCQKWQKTLERSKLSNAEAMEARTNPRLSTAKDMARVAHRAGMEQAKMGAVVGGGLALARNFWAVCKGKKNVKTALKDVGCDTAEAAGTSYVAGAGGALIMGGLKNAEKGALRAISKTNLPAYLAVGALECGKTLWRFSQGKIDGPQCLQELGKKGYGMVNCAAFAALGQVAIPIPIVGALAGSLIGGVLGSLSYDILQGALQEAALAREERIRIEKECNETIAMLKQLRAEMDEMVNRYFAEKRKEFDWAFTRLGQALSGGGFDADLCIAAANTITRACGKRPLFENMDGLRSLMDAEPYLTF